MKPSAAQISALPTKRKNARMKGWGSGVTASSLLAVTLTACSALPGATTSKDALRVGDCVTGPSRSATSEGRVLRVDCSKASQAVGKVLFIDKVADNAFPGNMPMLAARCTFEAEGQGLPLMPSQQSWEQNHDRTVVCIKMPDPTSDTSGR